MPMKDVYKRQVSIQRCEVMSAVASSVVTVHGSDSSQTPMREES